MQLEVFSQSIIPVDESMQVKWIHIRRNEKWKMKIWSVFQNAMNSFLWKVVGWTLFIICIKCITTISLKFFQIPKFTLSLFFQQGFSLSKFSSGSKIFILYVLPSFFCHFFHSLSPVHKSILYYWFKKLIEVFLKNKQFSFFCSHHLFVYTFIVYKYWMRCSLK